MNQTPQNNPRERTASQQSVPSSNNIQIIKKHILYDAQSFNINESYNHKKNRLMEKQKQLETYSQLNRRLQTQILTQKQRQKHRKDILKQQLKEQYDKQMRQHQNQRINYKQHEKTFAKQLESYQLNYHNRRMNDIARMYNPRAYHVGQSQAGDSRVQTEHSIGNLGGLRNPYLRYPSESIGNGIPTHKTFDNPDYDVEKMSLVNNINFKPSFNPFNPVAEQRKNQVKPQSYQQYLKKEIQRKNSNKIREKQQKLVKEHEQAIKNQLVYKDSIDQLKFMQKKQQQQFKKGLDQQLTQKRLKRNYF